MLSASRFSATDCLIQKSVLRGGVGLPDCLGQWSAPVKFT